jgi:hypothetical protein
MPIFCRGFCLLRNPSTAGELLPYHGDLQKILTATITAWCVHTRIATYLGGYERNSFHDWTKFGASIGSGFIWLTISTVGAKCREYKRDREDLRNDRSDLNKNRKDIRSDQRDLNKDRADRNKDLAI